MEKKLSILHFKRTRRTYSKKLLSDKNKLNKY